jgi:DNA-3-methyladenine glycosylase II
MEQQADLDRGIRLLTKADPRLLPIVGLAGMPQLRRREPGFAGLAAIVVGQQLSTASAAAIWGRLALALQPLNPDTVIAASDETLGRLGFSRAKIRTVKAVAGEILAGRLELGAMATMDANAAHAILTGLHGIGPWTADVYLLFCLGNADAWPAGDLAVQEGVRAGLGLTHRPGPKEMAVLAEPWRPFRGAAAHLWWAYYRYIRQRTGTQLG